MSPIQEWSKANELNSFSSWKGLLYAESYKAVIAGKFLPPFEVSFDLIHACQLRCDFCNAYRYLVEKPLKKKMLAPLEIDRTLVFLSRWGAKAICYGGGGESTLHPHFSKAVRLTKDLGMESGLITNGVSMDDEMVETLAFCNRFVGFSVDAATPQTYAKGKKKFCFEEVIHNIHRLLVSINKYHTKCDVAFKFLIYPFNQHEIYKACELAKSLGVKDFHARPADFNHQGMGKHKCPIAYNRDLIFEQFDKCRELEDENFRVFTVMHKYNDDLTPKRDFKQCYAAPICLQLCADGNAYFCLDQRFQKDYLLGSYVPDPSNIMSFWGGEKHRKLVFGSTPLKCKSRCTFAPYNKQCQELFASNADPMCVNFT